MFFYFNSLIFWASKLLNKVVIGHYSLPFAFYCIRNTHYLGIFVQQLVQRITTVKVTFSGYSILRWDVTAERQQKVYTQRIKTVPLCFCFFLITFTVTFFPSSSLSYIYKAKTRYSKHSMICFRSTMENTKYFNGSGMQWKQPKIVKLNLTTKSVIQCECHHVTRIKLCKHVILYCNYFVIFDLIIFKRVYVSRSAYGLSKLDVTSE